MKAVNSTSFDSPNIFMGGAGLGWIGQEGDRKLKELELKMKLDQKSKPGPGGPGSAPPRNEKYVFIGIAVGLVVGGGLGLWLGLATGWLKPIFWLGIMAVGGAVVGGLIGNFFKKKADKKYLPDTDIRGIK